MDIFDSIFETNTQDNNKIYGLVTGVVKEIYDEKFPGMVKVEILMLDGTVNVTDWIKVVVPYGGENKGMYFLPDIGDEVIIGFERGEIKRPFILGCIYNKNNNAVPKEAANQDNTIKKLKTKGGHEITFDDTKDKTKFTITTPKKREILIDDENSKILIKADDKDKNVIEINSESGEISVKSEKKITLEADSAKITIDGSGKSIKAEADSISLEGKKISIKGQNVSIDGAQTDINASGTLNVKSSGITNVKGSMVKIN